MSRTLYLAVFSNGPKPAHWGIFIPHDSNGPKGKALHATGNPATGFFLEFKRNFDLADETRVYKLIPLAEVQDKYIIDTPGLGLTLDTTARDRLESVATLVQPPGRSANPFDSAARNCQNWIEDYIDKLISDGVIIDADYTRTVLQNAPRKL